MRVTRQFGAATITATVAGTPLILLMPVFLLMPVAAAAQSEATPVPQTDTCTVDPDGTAHITRVIPVPGTISPEAQKFISRAGPSGPEPTLVSGGRTPTRSASPGPRKHASCTPLMSREKSSVVFNAT